MKIEIAILALLSASVALAQPVISGPNPQVRKPNGILYAIGTITPWTGSGPPGTVTGSQQGDFYLDLTNQITYQCYIGSGPCNAVASGNWVQVSSTNGTFTNLTVSTLQVTSPLYNAAAITGGLTAGGSLGITGGVTAAGGFTCTACAYAGNGMLLTNSSTSTLHITGGGGITIDSTGQIQMPSGALVANTVQTNFLAVTDTTTFTGLVTTVGDIDVGGNVVATGNLISTGGGLSVPNNIATSAGQVRVASAHVVLDPSGSITWANGAANLDASGNVNGVNAGFSGTVTSPNFYSNTGNLKLTGDNILFNRATVGTNQFLAFNVANLQQTTGAFRLQADAAGSLSVYRGNGASSVAQQTFQNNGEIDFYTGSGGSMTINQSLGIYGNLALSFPGYLATTGTGYQLQTTGATGVSQIQWCVTGVTCDPLHVGGGGWTAGTTSSGHWSVGAGTSGALVNVLDIDTAGNEIIPGLLTSNQITTTGMAVTGGGSLTMSGGGTVSAVGGGTLLGSFIRNASMVTSCGGHPTGTFYNTTTSATGGGTVVAVCP